MRLDFNVLWIDDQPNGLIGAIGSLRFHVEEEGFNLEVKQATSVEESMSLIQDHVLVDGIDLVLVDYDLGAGSGGEQVLAAMKTALPYKEVVFYSSVAPDKLRKLAFEEGVEGVYCANRMTLTDTIKGVFDALVKKVLDVDHCRGIILGATSEIDAMVEETLKAIEAKLSDEQRTAAVTKALKIIDNGLENSRKSRAKLDSVSTIEALLEHHYMLTSAGKLQLLRSILESCFGETWPGKGEMIKDYLGKVPPVRNLFGHAPLEAGATHKAIDNIGGTAIDVESLRLIRRELLSYRKRFLELAAAVIRIEE